MKCIISAYRKHLRSSNIDNRDFAEDDMSGKMTGAELASLLKGQLNEKIHSNMKLNGLDGVDDESLHLKDEQVKWWRDAKFGMFIHWGVYSVLGKGEWVYFNDKLDEEYYRDLAANEFKPNIFNSNFIAERKEKKVK